MNNQDVRSLINAYWQAAARGDFDAMAKCYAEDAVQEWPQSRERVVGRANIMAINRSYPGLPRATIHSIRGDGKGPWVTELTLDYGGDRYECVFIFEISGGVITRETDYFAAPFDAPAWRAQWTETL